MIILLKYWRIIVGIVVIISILGYASYYRKTIYNEGFKAGEVKCRQEWAKVELEREQATNKKIQEISNASKDLIRAHKENLDEVSKKINKALSKVKTVSGDIKNIKVEPLTTIPECKPTDKFIEVSNEIAKSVNSK